MSVIAKDFSPLVQALRQKVGRTSFHFVSKIYLLKKNG